MAVIAAGQPAPEFSLARAEGGPFTRADLEGKRTLLVFYPFAFSSVCTDQLSIYNELLGDFAAHGADALRRLLRRRRLPGGVPGAARHRRSRSSRTSSPRARPATRSASCTPRGFPQRALVLIGPDGVVEWSHEADSPGDLPGANLIFDALEAPAA